LNVAHGEDSQVWDFAVSPSGNFFVSCNGVNNSLRVFDTDETRRIAGQSQFTGYEIGLEADLKDITCVCVSPGGDFIVCGMRTGLLAIFQRNYETSNGEFERNVNSPLFNDHQRDIEAVTFCPDGSLLVTSSQDDHDNNIIVYVGERVRTPAGETPRHIRIA